MSSNGDKPAHSADGRLGLTKREYIAAQVLAGIAHADTVSTRHAHLLVKDAVDFADMLIEELDK